MPLLISVPDSANAASEVTLGGQDYTFEFNFNTRDSRYRFDILQNNVPVIRGLKIVENASLTSKYDLPNFNHGELLVINTEQTSDPVGRNNFGIGKPYELVYFTNAELTPTTT